MPAAERVRGVAGAAARQQAGQRRPGALEHASTVALMEHAQYVDAITREGDAPGGGAARASMRKCHRAHCGPSPICLVMSGAFTVT